MYRVTKLIPINPLIRRLTITAFQKSTWRNPDQAWVITSFSVRRMCAMPRSFPIELLKKRSKTSGKIGKGGSHMADSSCEELWSDRTREGLLRKRKLPKLRPALRESQGNSILTLETSRYTSRGCLLSLPRKKEQFEQ